MVRVFMQAAYYAADGDARQIGVLAAAKFERVEDGVRLVLGL
jgi:hypothetical protein